MVAMSEIKCKEEVENNDERIRNLIQFKVKNCLKSEYRSTFIWISYSRNNTKLYKT